MHFVHDVFYSEGRELFCSAGSWGMPDINFIRADIEHRRRQVARLRGDIRKLQHSGISSASADALLERMLNKIDELCAERDQLKKEQPGHNKGKVFGGRHW